MSEVVPLVDTHLRAAGALLATRHARERERFPLLPVEYEDPERAEDLVRGLLAFCDGVAAVDEGGGLLGFLTSFESTPDPTSPMARYLPRRCSMHLVHGHAVVAHATPSRVYTKLFAELAESSVGRGIIDYIVHVPIGDPVVEASWVALGFGRANLVAVRELTPIDRAVSSDVEVWQATADELDVVEQLVAEEALFHAAGPMFVPNVRDQTATAVRAELADALSADDHAFLIARRQARDIGIISIQPGIGSPLYVPDNAAYIAATAVIATERGSGAGAALADAAFAWARDRGYDAACLHFATANATSSSFWTGIGFTPVMAHLRRRLDERILTDRPPGLTLST